MSSGLAKIVYRSLAWIFKAVGRRDTVATGLDMTRPAAAASHILPTSLVRYRPSIGVSKLIVP